MSSAGQYINIIFIWWYETSYVFPGLKAAFQYSDVILAVLLVAFTNLVIISTLLTIIYSFVSSCIQEYTKIGFTIW